MSGYTVPWLALVSFVFLFTYKYSVLNPFIFYKLSHIVTAADLFASLHEYRH